MISKSISAVVGLGFLAMSSAQAATVSLTPATVDVGVGEAFSLNVDVTGFEPTIGATLGVDFDTSILALQSANPVAFDWLDFHFDPNDPSLLVQGVTFYNLDLSTVSGDFTAIQLNFERIATGGTTVSLIDDGINSFWLSADGSTPIDNATINYNNAVVPLPAAVWMMLGGLGLLGWTGRRRT